MPGAAARFKCLKLSVSRSGVMWCISAVNRVSLHFRAASRTPSNLVDALVRLCVRGAGGSTVFLLAARLPSRSSAGAGVDPPPLFGSFVGTTQASDFSSVVMPGLRPTAFPGTPEARLAAGTGEISQFLFEGLLRMLRVFDRVEPLDGSRVTPSSVLPSA